MLHAQLANHPEESHLGVLPAHSAPDRLKVLVQWAKTLGMRCFGTGVPPLVDVIQTTHAQSYASLCESSSEMGLRTDSQYLWFLATLSSYKRELGAWMASQRIVQFALCVSVDKGTHTSFFKRITDWGSFFICFGSHAIESSALAARRLIKKISLK